MNMVYHQLLLLVTFLCCGVSALNVPSLWTTTSHCRCRQPRSALNLAPPDVGPPTIASKNPTLVKEITQNAASYQNDDRLRFGVSKSLLNEQTRSIDHSDALLSTNNVLAISDESSAEQAGKWFFVIYVVFSVVAGMKEMGVRFQTWLQNRSNKS